MYRSSLVLESAHSPANSRLDDPRKLLLSLRCQTMTSCEPGSLKLRPLKAVVHYTEPINLKNSNLGPLPDLPPFSVVISALSKWKTGKASRPFGMLCDFDHSNSQARKVRNIFVRVLHGCFALMATVFSMKPEGGEHEFYPGLWYVVKVVPHCFVPEARKQLCASFWSRTCSSRCSLHQQRLLLLFICY